MTTSNDEETKEKEITTLVVEEPVAAPPFSESIEVLTQEKEEDPEPEPEPELFGIIEQLPVNAEDTYISEEIQQLCIEIGENRGYCPEFLMAIIEAESSGLQYAENGPCKGLMQINMDCQDVIDYMKEHGYTDIFDYRTNIELGCYVLDEKRRVYGDNVYAVLMGYNGSSRVLERVEAEDYTNYAIKVVERAWELERVHGK